MQIHLHPNTRTTPKTRALIQSSTLLVAQLARQLGVSETSVRRWKARDHVTDGSHTPLRLGQSTSPTDEALIRELRQDIGLSLDDIVQVMQRCVNPALSRRASSPRHSHPRSHSRARRGRGDARGGGPGGRGAAVPSNGAGAA